MSDHREVNKEGIADVFTWMGHTLTSLFKKAEPHVIDTLKMFFDKFEPVALAAVESEAVKVISGSEKFNSAVANVKATVEAQGWSVAEGLVQTLVQDAYLAWKASQKPVPGQLLVKAPQ